MTENPMGGVDDLRAVFKSGTPKLDILERQQSSTEITWVRFETGPELVAARNLKRRT